MTASWGSGTRALVLLGALVALAVVSLSDVSRTQWFFVHTTYYCLLATVMCWAALMLEGARGLRREVAVDWARQNWPGILVACAVTAVAVAAVEPALRMLSDEATLVGTSKNLFASKTATFTVSGKNYYGSYWDVDVAIDRRPTLFPFLVSLVHTICGYSYRNVFLFNGFVLLAFILLAYRLAKSMGGETFGIVSALWVAAHPITLLSARSGGFDLFAAFFGLLVLHELRDFTHDPRPIKLAKLWLYLCLLAEVRYESALFLPPVLALMLAFRMLTWSLLRPYAWLYAMTPAFLSPRVWQSVLRGNVPEQEPGVVAIGLDNFFRNAHEYFQPLLEPLHSFPGHAAILIALGVAGSILWLKWIAARAWQGQWKAPEVRFAAFVLVWMLVQVTIVFAYVWGRAQYPSAARLVIAIDVYFSFAAAWLVTRASPRGNRAVVLFAIAVLLVQLPVASQARMPNRLTQTRENAATWAFFEDLKQDRILIVTDRPSHFTIMNYGAMDFASARADSHLLTAFARHLFQDVYVIQQIELSSGRPLPGYEIWPDRKLEPVLEFQNDANVLIRVSRLVR